MSCQPISFFNVSQTHVAHQKFTYPWLVDAGQLRRAIHFGMDDESLARERTEDASRTR